MKDTYKDARTRNLGDAGASGILMQSDGPVIQGLYIMTTAEGWPCKIGVTTNLVERLLQVQVGNWHKIKPTDFWFVSLRAARRQSSQSAFALERAVHEKLSDIVERMSGEWFDVDAPDARRVVEKVASEAGFRIVRAEQVLAYDRSKITRLDDAAAMHDLYAVAATAHIAITGRAA
jgi:hypothetical protein